jgi:hypothetical protein
VWSSVPNYLYSIVPWFEVWYLSIFKVCIQVWFFVLKYVVMKIWTDLTMLICTDVLMNLCT